MAFEDILKRLEKEDKTFFKSRGEPEWRLPSGVPSLDNILGGGIPSGSFVQIYGPTGSGKTTLASTFLANAINMGKKSTYVHVEEMDKRYMEACGVNFDSANFSYWSSDYAERIFNTIRDGFLEDLNVAVVDSMGFLTSKKVMETDQVVEKGDKEAQMAATARMVADFMRKVKQPLFRTQGIIIVTNHVTTEIGGWKPRSVPAGGLKLQFGTSLRFRLFPKPIPEAQSIETKVTIDKSKDWDAVPWGTTSVDIVWRKGIDKIADIARLAKTSGIIEQKGAWIYYGGEKYQGFDSFKDAIRTNDRLRESLIQATSGVVPQEEEEVYIADEDGVIQET